MRRALAVLALLPELVAAAPTLDSGSTFPLSSTIDNGTPSTISVTNVTTSGAGLVVVAVAANTDSTSKLPFTVSGAGLTWTAIKQMTWGAGQSFPGAATAEVWAAWSSGALSVQSITATRTAGGNSVAAMSVWAYTAASVQSCSAAVTSCFGALGGKQQDASTTVDASLAGVASSSVIVGAFMEGATGGGLTALANTTWRASVSNATFGASVRTGDASGQSGSVTVGASTSSTLMATAAAEVLAAAVGGTAYLSTVSGAGVIGTMTTPDGTATLTGVSGTGVAKSLSRYPLSVHASGRYLVDAQGSPFRLNMESVWLMSVGASDAQVDSYIANRKAKGFNSFVVMPLVHANANYQGRIGATATLPSNYLGQHPWANPALVGDFSAAMNGSYWTRIDTMVAKARAEDMVIMLSVPYLGYNGGAEGWWTDISTNSNNSQAVMFAFGQWLANRYAAYPNVLWMTLGDFSPPAGEGSTRVHKVMEGIKAVNPSAVFLAEAGGPDQMAADVSGFNADGILHSFYGYGPAGNEQVFSTADRAWTQATTLPALVFEPNYFGEIYGGDGSRNQVRRSQWWGVTAGGTAGDNTGIKGLWDWGDPAAQLDLATGFDRKHLFDFFAPIPWYAMLPSGIGSGRLGKTLITAGGGSALTTITSQATASGSHLVAYVPPTGTGATTFSVDMTAMAGTSLARWYNPTSGAYTVTGTFANTGTQQFTTPGNNGTGTNDWILLLAQVASVSSTLTTSPATGAVGSVTATGAASSSFATSSSTGAVGALAGGGGGSLSGQSGTGAIGAMTTGGDTVTTVTGVAGTGQAGSVSSSSSASSTLAAAVGTGVVGSLASAGGDATATLAMVAGQGVAALIGILDLTHAPLVKLIVPRPLVLPLIYRPLGVTVTPRPLVPLTSPR